MDLLAHVPSWDDIERNLDHKFSELNQSVSHGLQSAHDGWDGFTRRVSNGASQAYGAMGGHRIDYVRQAMALSYPIVLNDLTRKWASINITEILPVLLKLVREVVMVLGGSVAVGGAIGGAVGSLAFGAGALPGAAVGGSIGLEVGNLILMSLGLASIAEYFWQGIPPCASSLSEGFGTAWGAEDGLKPPGLDPTGGSAALIQERTERAARQLASGQEQLVLLLLTAIVTYLTRGQMKAGVMNSMESIATRSATLQASISNKEFASWLAKNQSKILAEPELQIRNATPLGKIDPELEAMREHYAKQDPGFVSTDTLRKKTITFKPMGLSGEQIDDYLATSDGKKYLAKLIAADPKANLEEIYARAYGQIGSGSTIPKVINLNSPLVKIVPVTEEKISDFSPFFTTMEELKAAANTDKTLADSLGLPLISEDTKYKIYEITPLSPTEVFVNEIAPTTEFGGNIARTGGATQFLVPNRKEWSAAKLIGEIDN
ncbi:DUF6861 domain-containing protein [Pseudomonas abietaniphila]|uniref:DUF6861 domain-containing protein n=1 Tax=Pseudomonas abietaniphila TaxID=89065 RepID=UPI0007831204|nr:hypothetical protein [Pseudomonas abietaniphila]